MLRHPEAEGRMMTRLMLSLFSMITTSLMGTAIVIALTMGMDTLTPILIAAGVGFVLAIPASWLVARQIA
jgi:predicted PurR-regulated permease PerM